MTTYLRCTGKTCPICQGNADLVTVVPAHPIETSKKRKLLDIDQDLVVVATEYVEKQLATMKKFNATPLHLSSDQYAKLVYDCAKYPQQLRNLTKKASKQ